MTRVVEEGTTPPPRPPFEPAPDRELWPWLLLLLVLVIGGIVAAVVLTSRDDKKKSATPGTTVLSQPATTVTVARVTPTAPATTPKPAVARVKLANVLGIPASTAVERLRDDGFQPVVRSVFSTKPPGVVAAQKPGPGTQLAKGAAVTLSVSKGQPAKPVPDVVGQSESQAVSLLKAAGFGATPVDVPSSETKGNVIAQNPKAGEKTQPGTKIRLNVSSAAAPSGGTSTAPPAATTRARPAPAQPATVTIPDVEGKTLEEARLALRKVGILMEIRYVPSDQPSGTIVAQAKKPGPTAKRRDHMLVTVSEGGSGGTAAATLATVPNVVGMDEQSARTQLRQAGFSAVVEDYPTSDSSQDGEVVSEQPAPGTKAPKNSQIIIYVGRLQSTG